jgi:hypothetical protein
MAEKEKTKVKESEGTFVELKTMVTDYAIQQTLDPLKNLGQWVAFGVAGGMMLIIGFFLTGLGVLRLFQKADWTDGNWSFAPYMILFALLMVVAGMCFYAMTRTPEWMDDDE